MEVYNVQAITTLSGIYALREEWNKLWENIFPKNPYQCWEWNYNWTRSCAQEKSLYVLTARNLYGKLEGIAPLRKHINYGLINSLSFIGQEASICTDFILLKHSALEILGAFIKYIIEKSQIASFEFKITEPSHSIKSLKDILERLECYKFVFDGYTKRLRVYIGNDYEEYLTKLSCKMRQKIRGDTRKLEKQYNVKFYSTNANCDFSHQLETLFYLNSLKWGGDPKRNYLAHRACYHALYVKGIMKIFLLTCDDKAVGALSAYQIDDTFFAELAGFDYSILKVDLGKVFYNYVFRWAAVHGFKFFDFLSGEEPYKFRYKPEVFTKWKVSLYKNDRVFFMISNYYKLLEYSTKLKRGIVQNKLYRITKIHSIYQCIKDRVSK